MSELPSQRGPQSATERAAEPFADTPKPKRMHHLDALRASAMMLLVPYHAVRGTLKGVLKGGGDGGVYLKFSWFVHAWHMPLFFVLSGFLAAGALRRSGQPVSQARERLSRVGIPFAVGVLTVIPLLNVIVNYWANYGDKKVPSKREWEIGNIFNWRVQHLWFLDYLLCASLIVIAVWALSHNAAAVNRVVRRGFELIVGSWFAVPVLALLTTLCLSTFPDWQAPPTSDSVIPKPALLVYYLVFFCFGFMVAGRPHLIARVEGHPFIYLAVVVIVTPFAFDMFSEREQHGGDWGAHMLGIYLNGLLCWSALFAIWGFFAKLLNRPSSFWRYIADASLWIFLVHVLFVSFAQGYLGAHTEFSYPLRTVLTTSAGVAGSLILWELFVRRTRLGDFLSGKKRKPQPAPA